MVEESISSVPVPPIPHEQNLCRTLLAVEVFDGGAAELYPDAHGCILLLGGLASVLYAIHPWAPGSQP